METTTKLECILNKEELSNRKYYDIDVQYEGKTIMNCTVAWCLEPEFLMFIIHSHISEKLSLGVTQLEKTPDSFIYVDRCIDYINHTTVCKVTTIMEKIIP